MLINVTTIEKSKAAMPLISRICADIDSKWKEALLLQTKAELKLKELTVIQHANIEDELEELVEQTESYIVEIGNLDGLIHSLEPVTIHFPILYRCQEIVLCYIFGKDDSLCECHLINHKCEHRQPIESIENLDAPFK